MIGTLAALFVAALVFIVVVAGLAYQSWYANPLRSQIARATRHLQPDPWELSEGERDAISDVLADVVYTDTETGQIKWVTEGGLEGWTVREPLRDYEYTGSVLVQRPRWYYPVCYDGELYVIVTAKAKNLPKGTEPVPPAEECVWSWELVRTQTGQSLPGWYALKMTYADGENDFAVINTEDYGLLHTGGPANGMVMWENAVRNGETTTSSFSFSTPHILDNVVTADVNNEYPLV